jgi:hypothetical protein
MVIAGAKKIKIKGIIANTLRNEESSARKSSLVKNHPVRRRNTEIMIYAMGEKKYANISLRKMGITFFIVLRLPE